MKIKTTLISATHESKFGTSGYAALVKKNETVDSVIESIKSQCDYDENGRDEFFDSSISEIIIDTDDYESVDPVVETYCVRGIDEMDGLIFAKCSTKDKAEHAKKLLEDAGFVDCLEIMKSTLTLDKIVIDDKTIDL